MPANPRELFRLDAWDPSVARMCNDFKFCDLDFDQFFLRIKRQGVFMHSNVHAKLSPIVQLARQIAVKLGATQQFVDEPIEELLADTLIFDAVWPVYPEVGDVLGVPSCYRWKYRNIYCHSLRDYIEASYTSYDAQPINRRTLNCDRFDGGPFEDILRRQVELVK